MTTATSSVLSEREYEFTDYFAAFAVTCLIALAVTNRRADLGNILVAAAIGSVISFIAQRLAPAATSSRIGWVVLAVLNIGLGIAAALI